MEPHKDVIAYRVNDFCIAMSLGRSSVYKMLATGELKSVVIAGRRLIPSSECRRLLTEASADAR